MLVLLGYDFLLVRPGPMHHPLDRPDSCSRRRHRQRPLATTRNVWEDSTVVPGCRRRSGRFVVGRRSFLVGKPVATEHPNMLVVVVVVVGMRPLILDWPPRVVAKIEKCEPTRKTRTTGVRVRGIVVFSRVDPCKASSK